MECSRVWRHGVAGHRNEANPSWDPHTAGRGHSWRISRWKLQHGDTIAARPRKKTTRIREIRNEELERTKDYPGGAPRRRTQVRFGQDYRSRGSAEFP